MGHNGFIMIKREEKEEKEEKGEKGKISRVDIKVLDDGTFYYQGYMDNGNYESKDYSFSDIDSLIEALKDDFSYLKKEGMNKESMKDNGNNDLKKEIMRKRSYK